MSAAVTTAPTGGPPRTGTAQVVGAASRQDPVGVLLTLAVPALSLATVGALLAATSPPAAVVVAGVGLVVPLVARRPQLAAYAYLGLVPLLVGVPRGAVLPLVRLNEPLLALLLLGLLAGPVLAWAVSGRPLPRLVGLDWAVLALAVTSSVTTLLWMFARGATITSGDLQYALALWKFLALYALVRISLRRDEHVRRALAVTMVSLAVVAVVGILQAVAAFGVPGLLSAYAPPEDQDALSINRASATIGTPIGFADVMVMGLALAVGWFVKVGTHRLLAAAAAALFALAGAASGQASGLLGLLVGALVVGWTIRRLGVVLLALVPLGAVAAVVLQPVIAGRIERLDPVTGLPISWTGEYGRLANLQTYIWPRLAEGLNWLFGVQPSSRVPAPERWRDWVYIESGYTWLLWNGGVPLLLAFVAFVALALRATRTALRHGGPGTAAAGVAGTAAVAVLAVLMLLDPHLTLRGTGDLLFPLLAVCAGAQAAEAARRGATP